MKRILQHIYIGVILWFAIGIFSCTQNQDPLRVIKFGQDSIWQANKIISEFDDSWVLKKYFKYSEYFGYMGMSDIYNNRIISRINISLSSDSSYWSQEGLHVNHFYKIPQPFSVIKSLWEKTSRTKKIAGSGPLPSSKIDSLWNLYHKWYGTPNFLLEQADTIYINQGVVYHEKESLNSYLDLHSSSHINFKLLWQITHSIGEQLGYISDKGLCCLGYDIIKQYKDSMIDTMIIDSTNIMRKAIWNTENYQVSFFYPFQYRYIHDTTNLYCANAEINYQILNYEEVREHMADSIRKTYQIDDFIYLSLNDYTHNNPQSHWTDYGWLGFVTIGRPSNLDKRLIISVRYEVIMKDTYDEILYRSAPQTLDIVKDARKGAITHPMVSGEFFSHSYISFLTYDSKLSRVKNYAKHNKVKCILRPLAIIFNTGEVVRRND